MNVLLGLVLLAFSSLIGFAIFNKSKKSAAFMQDFELFLNLFENDISYNRSPLSVFINTNINKFGGEFQSVLSEFNKNHKIRHELLSEFNLDAFFASIGYSDAKTQLLSVGQARARLASLKTKLDKKQQKGEMSFKLGAIVGVGLFIIVL